MARETAVVNRQEYTPPFSLWKLVEQNVVEHEREEIKLMLGESLVDQSLELHREVDTLLEIWHDYRKETQCDHVMAVCLPEPPELRERLMKEICFLVENVKDKAANHGIDPQKVLSRHNSDIIAYALETSRPTSARGMTRLQHTPQSEDGLVTPKLSTPDDRLYAGSRLSEEVESMSDKFSFLLFDDVAQHLRSTLEKEISQLLEDISFLQQCLEDEASFQMGDGPALSREPTITELREERTSLEKELLSQETVRSTPTVARGTFSPAHQLRKMPPNMLSSKFRSVSHATSVGQGRHSPLKALHHISPSFENILQTDGNSVVKSDSEKTKFQFTGNSMNLTVSPTLPNDISFHQKPLEVRTTAGPRHMKVVSVDSIVDPANAEHLLHHGTPSPPLSVRHSDGRPSSADRFRKMVLECREGTV